MFKQKSYYHINLIAILLLNVLDNIHTIPRLILIAKILQHLKLTLDELLYTRLFISEVLSYSLLHIPIREVSKSNYLIIFFSYLCAVESFSVLTKLKTKPHV